MKDPFIDVFGVTNIGRVRGLNQDHFLIGHLAKALVIQESSGVFGDAGALFDEAMGRLLLVADGVGGAAAGEQASAFAVDSVARYILSFMPWWRNLEGGADDDLRVEMESAIHACEIELRGLEHSKPEVRGLGTTLTIAYLVWPKAYIVHVGDSRCYLNRGDRLEQITHDHTLAQQLADEGIIEQGEVETSPLSHLLWNAVGGDDTLAMPEIHRAELEPGDTLLLCSDGLTKHVSDAEIADVLQSGMDATSACEVLVGAANAGGGTDNVTAVVAKFGRPPG